MPEDEDREARARSALAEIDFHLSGTWGYLEGDKWAELKKSAENMADNAAALIGLCEEKHDAD